MYYKKLNTLKLYIVWFPEKFWGQNLFLIVKTMDNVIKVVNYIYHIHNFAAFSLPYIKQQIVILDVYCFL